MDTQLPSVETLFAEALKIPSAGERAAYLERACAGHEGLRRQVETLLEAHDRAGEFLEPPDLAATADRRRLAEGPGTVIGPYKLMEQIGEGGMGVVYMAGQSQPVRRKVALKIIKPGMDTRQVVARFEAERQALALMDHPNIAKVLDAGATDSGRPYFVMELVRGIPITDYCDREQLSITERLDLFVLVCRAVQHAHQKGIIHRDLKPSNVLVTVIDGVAVPKVIDFGVAKATGASLTERTLFTGLHQFVGTPLYMSPEQADVSGVDVDTRSDVYSLGLLLYELLTGTTPFDQEALRKAALDEVRRIIREEEPPKPSARLSTLGESLSTVSAKRKAAPRQLSHAVRGDLDWIVMKALEKDRNRRYETASAFAADLMNYLADRPAEACPPSAWYRFSKYARRHRAGLTTTALVGLALIAGTAVSTWQAVRATAAERQTRGERDRAVKAEARAWSEADKARAFNDFVTADLLKQAEPANNAAEDHVTLLEVLDRAAGKVGDRFGGRPEVEVSLRKLIANTYHSLASWEKAERQWRALRELARRPGAGPAALYEVHGALAHVLRHRGRNDEEALGMARSAADGLARVLGPDHPNTLTSRNNLALAYRAAGRTAEAIALLKATLKLREAKLGADHPETLTSRNNLAVAYQAAGRNAEAIALLEETLKLQETRLGADHPETLISRNNLAVAYRAADRTAEAIALHEVTLSLSEAKLGADHPNTLQSRNNLAAAYWRAGRLDRSIPMFEATLKAREAKLGPDHPETLWTKANLGVNYLDAGRRDESIRLLEDALGRGEALPGGLPASLGWVRLSLAMAYDRAGRPDRSEPFYRDDLARARSEFGPDDLRTAGAAFASNLLVQEKWSEAEPVLREWLRVRVSKAPDDWSTFNTRSMLGGSLLGQGKYPEAEHLIVAGYEGMKAREASIPPPGRARLEEAAVRVVRLYEAWGKPEQAAAWKEKLGLADLPADVFSRPGVR
jgi:serine/threonine protein kinase/tetratricopeptide (TPR) repeat protein